MRVLQINSVCGYGSTGRIATDIHKILLEEGHESYIAYGRGEVRGIEEKYSIKIGNKLDNYLHVARTRILDEHGLGSIKATKEFIDKVKKLNPDVIHLHNIHGYYLNYQLLFDYLKEADKKVIWTLHDCWSYTGHCSHYDFIGCKKWRDGSCGGCPEKKNYPASLFKDNSPNNFKIKKESFLGVKDLTIVTPSKWLAGEVKKSFLKDYKVKVINNGIDLEVFKPTKSTFRQENKLEDKFIILGVASVWIERKGLKYFLELAEMVSEDEKIVLVGLSKKQLKDLPKNILGIERTNSTKELAQIYTAADVFFNPTLEDTFPTTNLEAMACGTFGITFNTGGSPECYKEKAGFVIDKKETKKIYKLIKKNKNIIKVGCNKEHVKLYDKNDKFKEYLNLY